VNIVFLQVHVFRTFPPERLQSKILKSPAAAAAAAFAAPQPVLSSPLNGTSSLSPDPEETVSESRAVPESVQENLDGEQLREEPEVHSEILFRHIQGAQTTVSYGAFVLMSSNTLSCMFAVCFR
jgi:hypothetical protein